MTEKGYIHANKAYEINMRQNSKTDQAEHLMRVKSAIHKKS